MSIFRPMAKILGIQLPSWLTRSSPERPGTSLSNPASWLTALFGRESKAGVDVNADTAITVTAFWRAINILGDSIAGLPWYVEEVDDENNVFQRKNHPVANVLREPSNLYTSFVFRHTLTMHACIFGNGYAKIHRSPDGRPVRMTILDARHIRVLVDDDGIVFYEYRYRNKVELIISDDVFHISGPSLNGVAGLNIIDIHKDNLGTGIAARDFGANFFKNGAHLSGYIKYPTKLNAEGFDRVRRGWDSRYSGPENSGKTAILDQGAEFQALNMGPNDAGLLPSQKFNVEDIARITGVPMHMLQALDRATFNNIEQLSLEFGKYTVRPWVKRYEQEANRKLFRTMEKGRYRTRLNMDAFMRADTEARAEYYNKAIQNGWMSINEVRKTEKLNPVPGGDKHFIQLNMTTIDAAPSGQAQQNTEEDAV